MSFGVFILGMLAGIVIGVTFVDQLVNIVSRIEQAIITIVALIPICFYYSFRLVFHPVEFNTWEENKHLFKYKRLFKNFYVCYEAQTSKIWKLIFFMRLKNNS